MKQKVILFIVGILLGAVISTGAVILYTNSTNNNANDNEMMQEVNDMGTNQNNNSVSGSEVLEKSNNTSSTNESDN